MRLYAELARSNLMLVHERDNKLMNIEAVDLVHLARAEAAARGDLAELRDDQDPSSTAGAGHRADDGGARRDDRGDEPRQRAARGSASLVRQGRPGAGDHQCERHRGSRRPPRRKRAAGAQHREPSAAAREGGVRDRPRQSDPAGDHQPPGECDRGPVPGAAREPCLAHRGGRSGRHGRRRDRGLRRRHRSRQGRQGLRAVRRPRSRAGWGSVAICRTIVVGMAASSRSRGRIRAERSSASPCRPPPARKRPRRAGARPPSRKGPGLLPTPSPETPGREDRCRGQ